MTTHTDEARRIVDAMRTCQTNHPEKWLEPIAAALAAAERRGIEKCDKIVQDAIEILIGHSTIDAGALLCDVKDEIRALLPAAVAEPMSCPHRETGSLDAGNDAQQDRAGSERDKGGSSEPAAKCGMGLSSVFVGTNGELPPQESHPVAECPRGHGEMTGANPEFGTPACSACGTDPAAECARCENGIIRTLGGHNEEIIDYCPDCTKPAAKCATPCLICGGKKRVCYHADACVASQYPLSGRCIASAGECRMVPPCVVFEVDCPSCLKCANPECVNGEVPSNQGGWMSPVPCPSCGGAR